jgi:hypothetical protein
VLGVLLLVPLLLLLLLLLPPMKEFDCLALSFLLLFLPPGAGLLLFLGRGDGDEVFEGHVSCGVGGWAWYRGIVCVREVCVAMMASRSKRKMERGRVQGRYARLAGRDRARKSMHTQPPTRMPCRARIFACCCMWSSGLCSTIAFLNEHHRGNQIKAAIQPFSRGK